MKSKCGHELDHAPPDLEVMQSMGATEFRLAISFDRKCRIEVVWSSHIFVENQPMT